MDNGTYVAFLIVGVATVAVDGHLIYRSGLRYLANSYTERASATSMAKLVAVLFHLIVLGVLALLSVIDIPADGPIQAVVVRLGILLLLLAAAHAITIRVLNRMRDRLDVAELTMERAEARIGNQRPVNSVTTQPASRGETAVPRPTSSLPETGER